MKYSRVLVLIFLTALSLSCASRPASRSVLADPPPESILEFQPPQPREESISAFERALHNIKMNTPLVKKYFEPGTVNNSGIGAAAEEIAVKGECVINENRFTVTYDLAAAVQSSENVFRVSFCVEDPGGGISHNDELLWSPAEDEAGLLLSFDDDYFSMWRHYFDMLDAFGAKATFFVQGSIGSAAAEKDLESFCRQALARGHGLGYHSASHIDLTKVSREIFNRETIEAADAFFKSNIPFSAFAYPFGLSHPWMREALAPVFSTSRGYGVNVRLYNTKTINTDYIISKAIDNTVYPDDNKFESDIRLLLLAAKFSGSGIIPLTSHDISDTPWAIKPSRLEYLLKTAAELKLKFYTYEEIPRLFPNERP